MADIANVLTNLLQYPVSITAKSFRKVGELVNSSGVASKTVIERTIVQEIPRGMIYTRLAGILGASGMILGAVGGHYKYPKGQEEHLKKIFETANLFHLVSSLAMIGVPLASHPQTSATLFVLGTVMFCGPCYYRAFTGNLHLGPVTPFGGMLLIAGWLSFIF